MSSNSKTNRKGSKPRNPRKGSNYNSQSPTYDGVYGNPQLVHYFLNLMGTKCVLQVRNGSLFSGIFHTVSPDMDIVLTAAHRVESNFSSGNQFEVGVPSADKLIDELIFQIKDVVHMEIADVNLGYAEVSVKSNGDAGTEVKFPSANGAELRPLEPWDGGGDSTTDVTLGGLEEGLTGGSFNGTNGWEAEDMFRTNREQYGVKSSYNPDLPEYTTPLEDDNSENFEIRKARASKLAQEIEGSQNYIKNIALEVDDSTTEEEKFSSVSREFPPKFGRGRARPREQRNQRPGYYNQGPGNMPPRSGGFVPSGRVNPPSNIADSPISPPGQAKSFSRQGNNPQQSLPPRLQKNQQKDSSYEDRGSRGHNENAPHHPGYSNQPKPPRQTGSGRTGSYNKPVPDYTTQQALVESSMPGGAATPQTLSRDSSASLTQQPVSQWKSDERIPEAIPPNFTNPSMARNFPSSGRDQRCRSHPIQKVQVIPRILGRPNRLANRSVEDTRYAQAQQPAVAAGPAVPAHPIQTGPGHFPDKMGKHTSNPTYRQHVPQSSQDKTLYFTPQGVAPPVLTRPPTVSTALSPQCVSNIRRPAGGIADGKPTSLKKTMSGTSTQGAPLSKSSSTGSQSDLKELQDFQKKFILQIPHNPNDIPSEVAVAPRSKSIDETPSSRSGVGSAPLRPIPATQAHPAAPVVGEPSAASQRPPSLPAQPAVSAINPAQVDSVDNSPSASTAIAQQAMQSRSQVPAHSANVWPASEQQVATSAPPPPSINVPTPRTASTTSDVQTVSASAQFVSSPTEAATPATASSQKPAPAETSAQTAVAPVVENNKSSSTSSGEPAAESNTTLNPNAIEFTPRSFSVKPAGSNTPRSTTPVAPGSGYFNPSGTPILPSPAPGVTYFVSQKTPIPKQGIMSPSPSDTQMVGVNPHNIQHNVGHILPHNYASPQLVFAQNPAIVHHQQQPYSNVEPLIYSPHPAHPHHLVQPAGRFATADYSYQTSQSLQLQQQHHPSPHHQGQQQAVAHQQQHVQPAQTSSYITQQSQQAQPQQRPHSAHTPNAGQIPPASPANNVQQQMAVTTMSVQMHTPAPAQNQVLAPAPPHYYHIAHSPMHPVPNNPHASYGVARPYMVLPNHQPNPTGQHGYVQPAAAVSSAGHAQPQYPGGRQYHQQVVQSYQQPGQN